MATKVIIKKVRITIRYTAHKMKIQLIPSQPPCVLVAICSVGHKSWVNLVQQMMPRKDSDTWRYLFWQPVFWHLLPSSTYQSYFQLLWGRLCHSRAQMKETKITSSSSRRPWFGCFVPCHSDCRVHIQYVKMNRAKGGNAPLFQNNVSNWSRCESTQNKSSKFHDLPTKVYW